MKKFWIFTRMFLLCSKSYLKVCILTLICILVFYSCAFLPSTFSMTLNTFALAAYLNGHWFVLINWYFLIQFIILEKETVFFSYWEKQKEFFFLYFMKTKFGYLEATRFRLSVLSGHFNCFFSAMVSENPWHVAQ